MYFKANRDFSKASDSINHNYPYTDIQVSKKTRKAPGKHHMTCKSLTLVTKEDKRKGKN